MGPALGDGKAGQLQNGIIQRAGHLAGAAAVIDAAAPGHKNDGLLVAVGGGEGADLGVEIQRFPGL